MPVEREILQVFFLHISQMLNVSNFGNTADIYVIVHLVPHVCQHITVDGHTYYCCLLATNQGKYVRELFLKKNWRVSLSISVRITMIRCIVYLLLIYKMVHGLINNSVLLATLLFSKSDCLLKLCYNYWHLLRASMEGEQM
jgi:hypothetical protein